MRRQLRLLRQDELLIAPLIDRHEVLVARTGYESVEPCPRRMDTWLMTGTAMSIWRGSSRRRLASHPPSARIAPGLVSSGRIPLAGCGSITCRLSLEFCPLARCASRRQATACERSLSKTGADYSRPAKSAWFALNSRLSVFLCPGLT